MDVMFLVRAAIFSILVAVVTFFAVRASQRCDERCGRRESTIAGGYCYCLELAP